MTRTNDFETAADEWGRYDGTGAGVKFSPEARVHYTYSNAEDLLDNLEDLAEMLQHHEESQRPRLDILDDYYEGQNTSIAQGRRRKETHLADHRPTHAFAEYVSQFIQGYMVGVPIQVQHTEDAANEIIRDLNEQNDADAHNAELILDLSVYGRAYELLFRRQDDVVRFVRLDPLQTFVIYDDTVERKPIAGVRYFRRGYKQDQDERYQVEVYTDQNTHYFEASDMQSRNLMSVRDEPHYFDGVPVIEYENNRFRQGDYEKVLSLIDLYDAAEADTANYMTDLNDAMLKIKGNVELSAEEARKMKESNILFLKTEMAADGKEGSADADYIYKQYDVSGVEAYKNRIADDIHKFTNTPNMNDENFAGNASGVAMVYKLFGLEQKRVTKERLFKRSMKERYRLVNNLLSTGREGSFDVDELDIVFTPNLPKNLKDELETFAKLGGQLSNRTKLELLSFIDDPSEEEERLEEETEAKRLPYEFPTDNPQDEQQDPPPVEGETDGR
ncbi:phage portal protein [Bhargavaea ginsengi]|uniref:phage portal protein n=1 Tax=Bhargavaea ginsengi TaxID=426757 RepID=UPI003C75459F